MREVNIGSHSPFSSSLNDPQNGGLNELVVAVVLEVLVVVLVVILVLEMLTRFFDVVSKGNSC